MIEVGIAVGQRQGVEIDPSGVEADQIVLEIGAPAGGRAGRTADEIEAPVQIDHRPAPGGLVQPVDVLGKEKPTSILGLQARQGVMRVVGQGLPEPAPADHGARPVASARQLLRHECLEADWLRSFPVSVAVAIIGNARVRAAAGTGQNKQPLMAFDEGLERVGFHA
jgi:hypothetical protein